MAGSGEQAAPTSARGHDVSADPAAPEVRPSINTHVHLPPNFSAFRTVEDAVESGAREGLRVMGGSNFHDLRVYGRLKDAAVRAGIVPLFGIEIICVVDPLQADGIRVNDPANPGRMYLCGKGMARFDDPSREAQRLLSAIRAGDEQRMRGMVAHLESHFAASGWEPHLTDASIAQAVAERAGVPRAWVVLQERHVAMAYQDALFRGVTTAERRALLGRVFGGPAAADMEDAGAIAAEIRARLMRAGGAAFEPESQISFEDAYRLILDLGGIPCYPTLGDGVSPICPWEEPPAALAERLLERGIHAAELIPQRNAPAVVDAYVVAFRSAGLLVMAGTEHNTPRRIPLEPRCVDDSLPSALAREAFWEATCVVTAHQHLTASGRPGYVDSAGHLAPGFPDAEARISWFRDLGAGLIAEGAREVAR